MTPGKMCRLVLLGIRCRKWRQRQLDEEGIQAWANARGGALFESILGILERYEQDANLEARVLDNTDRETWIALGAAQAAKELREEFEETARKMEIRMQRGEE